MVRENKDKVNQRLVEAYSNAKRETVECECGGSYTLMDGNTHLMEGHYKTERHIQWTQGNVREKIHVQFNCECGGSYIAPGRAKHFRTTKHKTWLDLSLRDNTQAN